MKTSKEPFRLIGHAKALCNENKKLKLVNQKKLRQSLFGHRHSYVLVLICIQCGRKFENSGEQVVIQDHLKENPD